MNAWDRPYDCAIPEELRAAVKSRRQSPEGRQLKIKIVRRGNTEVFSYPWGEMQLGDFFFVPIRDNDPQKLKIRFRQVAARRDWELTCIKWLVGKKPMLRVCLSLLDVSETKRKAQQHHDVRHLRYSDGQWSNTRKARYLRTKGTPKLKLISEKVVMVDPKLVREAVIDHFAPVTEPASIDATLLPNYDRDQIVRDRLIALGIKS